MVAGTLLESFDRSGKETVLSHESDLQAVALSPKGGELAVSLGLSSGQLTGDVRIYNLRDNRKTKLTFDPHSVFPVWSPDGTRIAFLRTTDGYELVIKDVFSGGAEEVAREKPEK
jgi:Tol biopolymer transport system component